MAKSCSATLPIPPNALIVMHSLRPFELPLSTVETPGNDNSDMLPNGFHWNDDHSRMSLRSCVLILVAPATLPVMLTKTVRSDSLNAWYFVSHEIAIRYAARWVTKWEAEIRLHVGTG